MRKRFKQIFSAALAGIVMCTAITFYPVETKAAAKAATTNVWDGVSSADWMSYLDDSLKISEINLPGTHDSATQYVDTENYSQCQNKSITEQLNDGIRFLDIRLKDETGGKLYCVHASKDCYSDSKKKNKLYLDTVLSKCYEFLDAHPEETIVMSMKKDDGNTDDAVIESYIHNYIGSDKEKYWYLKNTTPALSEVRGKIVLMRRYYHTKGDDGHEYEDGYGVRIFWSDQGDSAVATPPWAGPTNVTRWGWVQWCVQDRYKYSDSNKWTAIQQGLDSPPHTTNQKVGDIYITPETTFFLNFMSSAGETTTILGQELPNTTPSAIANVVNPKFQSYTMEYGKNYGWIIMDFATQDLAKHVYTSNKSPKLEAEQKIAATIKALSIPGTVESDMVLPTTGEEVKGAAGTSITWSCSPANVLRTTGGKCTLVRQPSEDVNVTLTATVSSGNYSQQKEFKVLVKKLPEKFAELNTTIEKAEAILADPANAKYDLDSLETAVETARALTRQDADKVSETQIKAAMETLNTIMDREPALKSAKKLRENLIAWYPLTANSKDISGNHNNGTATGVTFSEENGARFSGESALSSYIKLPEAMFNRTAENDNLTVSFWVKDGQGAKSNAFGFGASTACSSGKHFIVNTNDGGKIKVSACPNGWGSDPSNITTAAPSANTWFHLTIVMEGKTLTVYKDGEKVNSVTEDYSLAEMGSNVFAYIGNAVYAHNQWNADPDFRGNIKDFRVYDCAIAPELIEKIYNDKDMDISSDSGHLIARYPLTADSKNVAGKGNHGVATGVTFSPENGATFTDGGKKQSIISLPTAMFDGEEQMTFSFWAKDTKSSGSNTVFGIGSGTKPDADGGEDVFKYMLINTNYKERSLRVIMTNNTWHAEKGFQNEECRFPANEWAHITTVFDGTKITLYKNGALIGTQDTGDTKLTDIGKNTVACIGNSIWTHNDVDYSGSVKDFRIYDCALSDAEAKGLMDESIKDEVMESLISALGLDIIKGEDGSLSMSITDAITLPSTVSGGTISWSSDKTTVIDNTGKVTLPTADKNSENVTLTATVKINGQDSKITFHCEVFAKRDDIRTADLQAVISSAETILSGLNEADYTTSSWRELQEALEAAKQQLSSPTTQADIDAVQAALQEKKTALAKLGDKTALNALINTVKLLDQEEYTTASWTELQTELAEAEKRAKLDDLSQADVDTAKDNLSAKKEALVKRGDKTKLNAAIAAAEALDKDDYTTDTWDSLQDTIAEIKETTVNNIDATVADVAAAEQKLSDAVAALRKISYTVTFKLDSDSEYTTKTVERKDKASAPDEVPQKEGYIFDGWFEAGAEEAFDFNTPIKSNITLTAKWAVKRIVTFDPDNNTATWTVGVKDGGKVTKPGTPVKPGYGFEYWYAEGEESPFDFGNRIITESITLKAKWIAGHTVTFDPDNDTEPWTEVVKDGETVTKPEETPEKAGYEFEYWYAEGEESAFDFEKGITADTTLKAKWRKLCTVTFEPDNDTEPWTEVVKDGETVTKPEETPEKAGYEFEYWYEEGKDSEFNFANTEITADITLKAKWRKLCTVTFNPDNGTATWAETVKEGEKVSKPEAPEKAGYEFEYWYEEGKDSEFNFANTEITADITLKAKWTKLCTVTFNPDNGTATWAETVKEGEKVSKPETPEKAGYEFEYWYEEGKDSEFNFETRVITADITLKAKWTEEQGGDDEQNRVVTFDPDNGTATWTETVKDGEKVSMPAKTLEKEGFEFEYWYEEGQDSEFNFANTSITADITLKAKWKQSQGGDEQNRVVTFNPDNGTATWTETVKDGEKVTMPTKTLEKAGYEFEYWYAEDKDTEFNFANTPITADITLTAKWKKTPDSATILEPTVSQEGTGSIDVNVDAGSIEPDKKTEVAVAIPDSIGENIKNCEEKEVSINVNIPDGMKNNENVDLTTITLPKEALEAARDEGKDLIITVDGDSSYQWVFTAEELKSATITEKNLLLKKGSAMEDEAKLALKDGAEGMAFTVPGQEQGAVSGSVSVDTKEMNWKPGDEVNLSSYDPATKTLEPVSGTYTVDENGKVVIKPQAGTTYVLWKQISGTATETVTLKPSVSQKEEGSFIVEIPEFVPDKKTEVAIAIPDSLADDIRNCQEKDVSISVDIPENMRNNEMIEWTAITLPKEVLEAVKSAEKNLTITVNGHSSYRWVFTAEELVSATITEQNLLVEKDSAKAAEVKGKLNADEEGMVFSFARAVLGSVSVDTEGMNWKSGDEVKLSYYNSETQTLEPVSGTYTVDENGKVTIKDPQAGSYVLWRKTATAVTSVTLNKDKLTLAAGSNETLTATVLPENAGDKAVTWKSSDDKIATVDSNGKVVAKKAGTVKITATSQDGTRKAECTVTVVSLSLTKVSLGLKESLTLKVNGAAKGAKIAWTPGNKKVADVKNGKVTAKKVNKKAVVITATVDGVKLTCKVTVKAAPKSITLNAKSATLKKGKTFQIKVKKFSPKNAASYKLTYSIDKKGRKVVSVDSNGKIKAKNKGKATITVTTFNKRKATIKVTVK